MANRSDYLLPSIIEKDKKWISLGAQEDYPECDLNLEDLALLETILRNNLPKQQFEERLFSTKV